MRLHLVILQKKEVMGGEVGNGVWKEANVAKDVVKSRVYT